MNCPNCSTTLSLLAKFYPCTPERVFKCPKCHLRFTETALENWPICAACGELLTPLNIQQEESICQKCQDKFNQASVPWE
jgi:hypothetical protein